MGRRRDDLPIAGHPRAIVIDTIGKMIENRMTLFAFAPIAPRFTAMTGWARTRPARGPSTWTRSSPSAAPDSPSVRMKPVPCPYCGGRNVDFRITGPGRPSACLPA
jgi:hypothetical protein